MRRLGTIEELGRRWGMPQVTELMHRELPVFANARLRVCAGRMRSLAATDEPVHIELNPELLKPGREQDRNATFLHEVAHVIAGHKAGHGYAWQVAAYRLGASTRRCHALSYLIEKRREHRAVAQCEKCGRVFHRARVSQAIRSGLARHAGCGGFVSVTKRTDSLNHEERSS